MRKTTKKKVKSQTALERKKYRVNYVLACKKEADDATKAWRRQRQELWTLFQNHQDTSKKKDWQSDCFIPKIFNRVLRAQSLVKRALFQTAKLFKFEPDTSELDEQITLLEMERDEQQSTESVMDMSDEAAKLRRARDRKTKQVQQLERKFKRKLADTNMANVFAEMTTAALLLGLGDPKVLWEGNSDGNAVFDNVDVLNLYIPPGYKPFSTKPPLYLIERRTMPLAELRKLATDTNTATGKALFDFAEIDKLSKDMSGQVKEGERSRKGFGDFTPATKNVTILEFWGSIIDEDGLDIEENQVLMIVNDTHLIYDQSNPFDHAMPPHTLTYPMTYPHRGTAGISIAEPVVKLQYAYNSLFQMFIDNLNFVVNKMFEYDPNRLMYPTDVMTVYPGKCIAKTGSEKVMQEIITGGIAPETLLSLQLINREIDEGSAVTEFVQGMPGTKSKTLGEVKIKTAESHGMFDGIARDIEQNSLKVLLEKTYDLYAQFADFPKRKGLFQMSVGGISLLLVQQELSEKVMQIFGVLGKTPTLAPYTDVPDLWRKLLSIYNLSEVYKDPQSAGQLPESQQEMIRQKAAEDAKLAVAQMGPGNIQGVPNV